MSSSTSFYYAYFNFVIYYYKEGFPLFWARYVIIHVRKLEARSTTRVQVTKTHSFIYSMRHGLRSSFVGMDSEFWICVRPDRVYVALTLTRRRQGTKGRLSFYCVAFEKQYGDKEALQEIEVFIAVHYSVYLCCAMFKFLIVFHFWETLRIGRLKKQMVTRRIHSITYFKTLSKLEARIKKLTRLTLSEIFTLPLISLRKIVLSQVSRNLSRKLLEWKREEISQLVFYFWSIWICSICNRQESKAAEDLNLDLSSTRRKCSIESLYLSLAYRFHCRFSV